MIEGSDRIKPARGYSISSLMKTVLTQSAHVTSMGANNPPGLPAAIKSVLDGAGSATFFHADCLINH
jgi:hypothetical protein